MRSKLYALRNGGLMKHEFKIIRIFNKGDTTELTQAFNDGFVFVRATEYIHTGPEPTDGYTDYVVKRPLPGQEEKRVLEVPGLGERLRKAIDRDEYKLAKIARLAGVNRGNIYSIMERNSASALAIYKLCKVLNVSADWLLFGDEDLDFLKKGE